MNPFKRALENTLSHEGVYDNNPHDTGGQTVYGIARKSNPNWEGWKLVDDLLGNDTRRTANNTKKIEDASEILMLYVERLYKQRYWNVNNLDSVAATGSYKLGEKLFDVGVNMGPGQAAKFLQEALNCLNASEKPLIVDGGLGALTLAALAKYGGTSSRRSRTVSEVDNVIIKTINGLQFEKYHRIIKNNPVQKAFFFGWINRRIK